MSFIQKSIQHQVKKSLYDFNAENRAHRVISQEKPKKAPLHKSSQLELEQITKLTPNFYEKHIVKDRDLDKRLKQVYVSSKDILPEKNIFKENPSRPLPQDRKMFDAPDYGYIQPENVPPGKINLKNALQLISDYQVDKIKNNPQKLALDYKLEVEMINTVLKYYKTFDLYISPKDKPKPTPKPLTEDEAADIEFKKLLK